MTLCVAKQKRLSTTLHNVAHLCVIIPGKYEPSEPVNNWAEGRAAVAEALFDVHNVSSSRRTLHGARGDVLALSSLWSLIDGAIFVIISNGLSFQSVRENIT